MTPPRATSSKVSRLARTQPHGAEPDGRLVGDALKALPQPPARVLALSRDPVLLERLLRDKGYGSPTILSSTTMAEATLENLSPGPGGTAPFDAVVSIVGLESFADPLAMADRLLALLAEGGIFSFVGILSTGSSDDPKSLAALETLLASRGVAISPPVSVSGGVSAAAPGPEDGAERERLQRLASDTGVYISLRGKKTAFPVRSYREGDAAAIADLFESSFHHRRGEEHWKWEYLHNPWGGPAVTLGLDGDGALVAHYAGYPMRFLEARPDRDPTVLTSFQIGDTMTAPRVRHVGRGPTSLLARTAKSFYARFCRERIAFNYGFNEGNIRRFSERFLEALYVEPVPFRTRELSADGLPLRGLSRWRRFVGGETISRLDAPPSDCDALLHRALPAYGMLVQRDSAYLRWRYFERPGFRYAMFSARRRGSLRAWAIFRREEEALLLGDLLVHPDAISLLEPILAAALASEFAQGAKRIEGWFPERPAFLAAELQRLGFERRPHPQDLALMCVPFEERHPEETFREKLFYTLGDSDLF